MMNRLQSSLQLKGGGTVKERALGIISNLFFIEEIDKCFDEKFIYKKAI